VRWTFLIGILLVLSGASLHAQTAPPSVYAIVGARIEVGDGRVLEKGTVLIRDGLIEAVGKEVVVPPDAEVFKGDGMVVYPGFIDAQTATGLKLPDWQPNQDTAPDTVAVASPSMREANRKGVRPELRAMDCLALTEATLTPIRQQGFTTALVMPSGGTINGVGALVNLSGQPRRDCVVRPDVGLDFTFTTLRGSTPFGSDGYPGSLMGIIAHLRQTLLDARYFHTLQTAFANGNHHRPPADDTLAALQPALSGALPVFFEADSEKEIHRALGLADEFGLHLILSGGAEAWKAAPTLVQRHVPILVSLNFGDEPGVKPGAEPPGPGGPPEEADSTPARPQGTQRPRRMPGGAASGASADDEEDVPKSVLADRHRLWEEKVANASRLDRAGALFAFTTRGTKSPAEFWKNLRRAVQAGLPRDAALRALTVNPARIFGVDRQMGTVEPGKIATLVVMTGDFADPKSKVRYLFIDKSKFDTEQERAPRAPMPPMPTLETEDP
jgi:imidazolonepropionase-like amidohydrolase